MDQSGDSLPAVPYLSNRGVYLVRRVAEVARNYRWPDGASGVAAKTGRISGGADNQEMRQARGVVSSKFKSKRT